MHGQPSAVELIAAVRAFLEDRALPELSGRNAFHARVAVNALAIVERELSLQPTAARGERLRLLELIGGPDSEADDLETLNRELCRRIRAGEIDLSTPGVAEHLRQTTYDTLAVDQPKYEAYRRAATG